MERAADPVSSPVSIPVSSPEASSAPTPAWPSGPAWNSRLALLLESTGEGIYGVDTEGRCNFVNRAAAHLLGYRADAMLGQNMHELIHHTHADGRHYPEAECPIYNAFRQGLPCRIDSEVLWRADRSPVQAEYSSYPVLEEGRVQGAVVTLVDITERKRAEALLQQARAELERRVGARTAELSNALGQLRELSAYLETVREDERTRIAREIHDELGSLLVALKMDVSWLGSRVADRDELRDKCVGMGRTIDTAVDNVGRIITDLRPSILDHQGLWAALEWQAQAFVDAAELRSDVQVHVEAGVAMPAGARGEVGGEVRDDVRSDVRDDVQSERWAIAVFRIFQEMLSNVARHARAETLRIRLYVDGPPAPMLYLEVEDDGVGATKAALDHPRSYGVMGMRERAGHFGGCLRIDGAPGRGTRVRLTMPLPPPASSATERAATP